MKKVGLLTFHRTNNFGSYLQAYGLYKAIVQLGYNCEIVDYRSVSIEGREGLLKSHRERGLKALAKRILYGRKMKKKAFNLHKFFYEHTHFSPEYTQENIAEAENRFDKIIIGSDLVWDTTITENDYTFMLDFVKNSNKKFAFASSVGNIIERNNDARCKELLKDFSQIAVREKDAQEWIESFYQGRVDWVCDPTMLLNCEEWNALCDDKPLKRKYVLVYFNNDTGKCLEDAKVYAQKENCDVLIIHCGRRIKGVKAVSPTTLGAFLSLIKHADRVFTASYHGMLFSVYFNTPFLFYTRAQKSRVLSLASKLGVEDCCGDMVDMVDINNIPTIHYEQINEKVENFRKQSLSILAEMLKGCENS